MRTKWEYLIESHLDQSEMAALGSEGWELVAVTRSEGNPSAHIVMYFKRPLPVEGVADWMTALDVTGTLREPGS